MTKRIPAKHVQSVPQPAMITNTADVEGNSLTIVPLQRDGHVAGFEVRCRCGAHAVVDCVYEEPAANTDPAPEAAPTEPEAVS